MKEYIEREVAKNAFPKAEADAFENCRYCTCLDSGQIGEILDNVPAADVVPVRHGKWETAFLAHEYLGCRPYAHYCSVCHQIIAFRTFYCPNCGARMDGDGE